MENLTTAFRQWWNNSAFLRILFIGFVILLLQIPISMISNQINERQWTEQDAIADVAQKWGQAQTLLGPRLVVPYYKVTTWKNKHGQTEQSRKKRYASFLADELTIDAKIDNQTRYRGIFKVPLYQSHIGIKGHFKKPNFERWEIDPKLILWQQAEFIFEVSGANSIQNSIELNWNKKTYAMETGLGESNINAAGFNALLADNFSKDKYSFDIQLTLNGSERLFIAPMSGLTQISMSSNWPDPSFQGYKLPNQHEVSPDGFHAQWNIPAISLSYPQQWLHHDFEHSNLQHSLVGVDFISPIDTYSMSERSTKYALLFLLLTFALIWVFELITKQRVHLMQYLFLGLGMCMFYLLLLAFSEHVGFTWAYVIASALVVTMTTTYAKAIVKNNKYAFSIGGVSLALYGYLYTLLQEQSYALLIGALGIFLSLAIIMFLTRKIDWFAK